MLKISAEFSHRRSRAFLAFLDQARKISGYYEKRDAAGRVTHGIDFTERTYIKIVDGFGDTLERVWGGVYYVNGRQLRLTHVWQRYLRTDIVDTAGCPDCGTIIWDYPGRAQLLASYKDGRLDIQARTSCPGCGRDVTDLERVILAVYSGKTPRDFVRKCRGEA